ncbi:hypothetical protein BRARA_I01049 [Brassica rapa]|uniref:HTH La-type RNA-binding domain-containing protein n=1 Tax=Brassica campestris TaxID=3711 RepID=A0A397XSL1_BRACM|nr:hypothetical protein BRARA_I01049 [Brassica rapa]
MMKALFIYIEFSADFNKLKALTSNIQVILDSLQGSDMVEVQGYEIRNGRVWRKYVMPHDWRVTFYSSQEYVMANNHQHMQLEQKPEIMEKEKSDYSEKFEGNAENKPARNKQIMEALSWSSLTETAKAALCSNKSSTDSLKSIGCDGSSSSVSFFSQV